MRDIGLKETLDEWNLRSDTYGGAYDQRGLHDCPEGKVCPVLCRREISIANLQHIWIGMTPKANVVHLEAVFIGDFGDTCPIRYLLY